MRCRLDYSKKKLLLISRYQKEFPLCSRPFLKIASELSNDLNNTEDEIRKSFQLMINEDLISRVGPVFSTGRVGKSFLAAIKCPIEKIEEVAQIINSFKEVNHNYLRENELNIWFVMTSVDEDSLNKKVEELEKLIGLTIYQFPMIRSFKIDLSLKEEVNEY